MISGTRIPLLACDLRASTQEQDQAQFALPVRSTWSTYDYWNGSRLLLDMFYRIWTYPSAAVRS
jgi:hypothetical protein